MEADFKSFDKILHIDKICMNITQKLHGTNAQVYIYKDENDSFQIKAGSRSRWLTEENDNYSFAKFVQEHKKDLIEMLGEGRHYGEWCGPGINLGEGLKEKTFFLFNWKRWLNKYLPPNVALIPLLYEGDLSLDAIEETMEKLKTNGSFLVKGYMKPEGIVVDIDGKLYKNVFDAEEIKWKEKNKFINDKISMDVSHLLQPIRLEKLLSRDESYIRNYPGSLGRICSDYFKDLESENQFISNEEDLLKIEKKALGKQIFYFVKSIIRK